MTVEITTNSAPRDILDAHELTETERGSFDYVDWPAVERGEESASFFRYGGELYDLGDVPSTRDLPDGHELRAWDGYVSETFFSGVVVRIVEDGERVIVGRYFARD